MRILVTGATGFIGNHVIDHLLQKGHEIIATSAHVDKAKQFPWYNQVRYIQFDLSAFHKGENYFAFFEKPDKMLHLAWEGLPRYKEDFHLKKNLPGHYLFLSNLIENGLNDLTVAGTCLEYGMQEGCLKETDPAMPLFAYPSAKNQLRMMLEKLSTEFQFNLKWVRLFYMYGKGQNPNSLLSQLDRAIEQGDEEFNMSEGEQVRDYLPVEKVAEYLSAITLNQNFTGIVNCCSNEPVRLKDFVADYLKHKNSQIKINFGYYSYNDYEPMRFWGDNSRLLSILKNE